MRWPLGHLTWPLNLQNKKTKKKQTKTPTKTNKEGLGQVRWPFGATWPLTPPENTQKTKNKKDTENQKKTTKKNKNTQKWAFQLSVIFSLFWWVSKFSLFWQLGQNVRTQKHYKNRGFSNPFFGKQFCVTKRSFLEKNKNKSRNSSYHFVLPFSSLSTTKTHKNQLKPLFLLCLANLKKERFQNFNLKHRKLKSPIFAPFFEKGNC